MVLKKVVIMIDSMVDSQPARTFETFASTSENAYMFSLLEQTALNVCFPKIEWKPRYDLNVAITFKHCASLLF
jgi:hypothetical protein